MTFSAGIIIEERDKPVFRKSGTARIVGEKIIFEAEEKTIELPAKGCSITLGGTGNKQAYVTHSVRKDTTLQINDFSFFKHPVFDNCPEAQKFKSTNNAHNGLLYGGILLLAALIIVPFYMIFIERAYLIGKIVDHVPPRYDKTIGDLAIGAQIAGDKVIDDPDIIADLKRMTAPLLRAAKKEPFEYNLHIVKDPVVNAYALPGGHIIINSGLIEKTKTPEELLGVIGHEIAHINERHSMKQIMHSVSAWVFITLLGADPNHLVIMLSDQAQLLSSRGYSRKAESEADREGFKYLTSAGINPEGLQGFFGILKAEENALINNEVFGLLSTHPLTQDRIDALNQIMDNANLNSADFPPINVNYEKFKSKLSKASGAKPPADNTNQ